MNDTEFIDRIKKVLSEDCIVKLRKVDPRISHYELYVKLRKEDVDKIKKI